PGHLPPPRGLVARRLHRAGLRLHRLAQFHLPRQGAGLRHDAKADGLGAACSLRHVQGLARTFEVIELPLGLGLEDLPLGEIGQLHDWPPASGPKGFGSTPDIARNWPSATPRRFVLSKYSG